MRAYDEASDYAANFKAKYAEMHLALVNFTRFNSNFGQTLSSQKLNMRSTKKIERVVPAHFCREQSVSMQIRPIQASSKTKAKKHSFLTAWLSLK